MNKILEHAIRYAKLDWKMFAVNNRKKPVVNRSWIDECTTDLKELERLFGKNPHFGIGVATQQSNLFVVDCDVKNNGLQHLDELEDEHGKLPDTLVSQTGGGGKHVFFKRPEGGVKNSAGKIAPGIDVRCDNGYVLIPPSPHHSGGEYCWIDDEPEDIQIAEAPEWILNLARGNQAEVVPINGNQPRPLPQQGWRGRSDVREGERHSSMVSFIGFLIQQGGKIERIIRKVNYTNQRHCIPPLPDDELQKMLTRLIARWSPEEAQQTGVIRPLSFYHNHK